MQLSQKQLHQKNKQQNNKHRAMYQLLQLLVACAWETSSQSGLCISEKSLRDLHCLGFDTESNLASKKFFHWCVCVCVCFETFFCWEHNCAFWFWRLLAKEPRSIVISNGPMESDTQSWLVHSEHPCINFPSGQQCVWCGHHPMFFAECLRHQCWRWRVVQDRVWLGHGQVNHFNNDVEHRLCVWACGFGNVKCVAIGCNANIPDLNVLKHILVGQRHWPWKAYVQGRRRTHRFFCSRMIPRFSLAVHSAVHQILLRLPGWKINLTWNQDFRRHWLPNWLFNKNSFRSTRSTSGPWFRFSRSFEPAISRVNSRTVLVRWLLDFPSVKDVKVKVKELQS